MKHDLTDVTFNIPLRYDTDDRINNIKAVMSYLTNNFDTNIIILESGPEAKILEHIRSYCTDKVKYIFIKEDSPIFHRTKFLNIMAKESKTPIIVNYDADVILTIPQYLNARDKIKNGELDLCTSFNTITYNVYKQYVKRIEDEKNITWINENMVDAPHKWAIAKGGSVFWNTKKFIDGGMENENFISWSAEDQERELRFSKLGYKWGRVEGILLHLEHERLLNSNDSHPYAKHNDEEFAKIQNMTKEQLQAYIKTWTWIK